MSDTDISGVTLEAIKARSKLLRPYLIRTPTTQVTSERLRQMLSGAEIFLKLECFQYTGTFKARGALSVAYHIPNSQKSNGITAASAGNHAIAAAWAAKVFGLSAKVVMQSTANAFRVAMARSYGAELVIKHPGNPTFDEAERLVKEEKRSFIHPFEGVHTSLGTAGVGLELMEDLPRLEAVVVSCGGGGLISGVAAAVKLINPSCKVFGVEPIGADSMSQSLKAGHPITLDKTETVADSLAPPMTLPMCFNLCRSFLDDIVTVSDDEICAGLVLLQEDAKLAVEPAAGATMAGLIGPLRERLAGKRTCIIVCGSNLDSATYTKLIERGQRYITK